jgi:uncharacterized protein with HEPN domain
VKSDDLYLVDIEERVRRVHASAAEGRDTFFASLEKQDAILHNLQLLGESVKRISEELKGRHPEVPWRDIAAFRNVVVHDYLGVDLELMWRIVVERIPELRLQIERILGESR